MLQRFVLARKIRGFSLEKNHLKGEGELSKQKRYYCIRERWSISGSKYEECAQNIREWTEDAEQWSKHHRMCLEGNVW